MRNNANYPTNYHSHQTTGLVLNVDMPTHSVTLNQSLHNPRTPLHAPAVGSYQPLQSNDILVDHGYLPTFEEYSPSTNGSMNPIMTVAFGPFNTTSPDGGEVFSHRVLQQSWIVCPQTSPSVITAQENGGIAVYMSWNGATDYETWNIYSGESSTSSLLTATVPRLGRFEAKGALPSITHVNGTMTSMKYVQVEAVLSSTLCQGTGSAKSAVIAVS